MMYLKDLMIFQFLVLLVVRNSLAFSCVPCALLNGCPELNCLGEKVLGMCGCCYVCAKQLGESCGGLYGSTGTCDQGLRCVLPLQQVNETMTIIYHVGVCQVQTTASPQATTQPANFTEQHDSTTANAQTTLRYNATIPQGDLRDNSTLRQNTTEQQVSSNINSTSPFPKLENGASSSVRAKGIQVLCLIMSVYVLFHLPVL
ncbi:insulin-like growth factor-binding protein 2 isoform X2 [Tachysurus vachellii]|uniref:insulin-like growth factor-binding protein 2 isoform X2 n=1 Tax=Tachysurus vachellii TaxID=175792 RepID=UPI00296B38BA|nr:insulin-like growth factor-binding protein 2 isoform X2 [Tachysurus vachellii]